MIIKKATGEKIPQTTQALVIDWQNVKQLLGWNVVRGIDAPK